MIELPEAVVLAGQIEARITGKKVMNVTAAHTPHKFAWYYGDPQKYHEALTGKTIGKAGNHASFVEICADGMVILLGEGVNLRYFAEGEKLPGKHQLLIEFSDYSCLVGSVQMYGGIWVFPEGENDNKYYLIAREKPSPLSESFDAEYFNSLFSGVPDTISLKAFLATEQRIPGLGNGVLQDILFNSGLHPRKKVKTLTDGDKERLFNSVKTTLARMVFEGGRDTERDLYGCKGGYRTILSKNTADKPCGICGTVIKKEAYLGGSIYYCEGCQQK